MELYARALDTQSEKATTFLISMDLSTTSSPGNRRKTCPMGYDLSPLRKTIKSTSDTERLTSNPFDNYRRSRLTLVILINIQLHSNANEAE